ncbi:MAG: SoxR reducing system RseC family protein [Bacteroidales bacterium]|nr:SoxR reducing system RseC family protein [Bacteroidales bacterium]
MAKDVIEHKGRIDSIEGNRIKVHFVTMSACSNCHAKSVCSAAGMENKEIEVIDTSARFQEGEEVKVLLKQSLGFKALFFGYVFPFLLLLLALFSFSAIFKHEVVAGLLSLGILVPYYFIIYYRRNYFERSFTFHLQKIS